MKVTLLASLLVLTADSLQAAILRGGDQNALGKSALRSFVSDHIMPRSDSADSVASTERRKSGMALFKDKAKDLFNRKGYDMLSYPDGVFHSMKALATGRAHTISIFRGGDSHHRPLFKSNPGDISVRNGEKMRLIQTVLDSNADKKLCIMTKSTVTASNNDALQQFTRAMIAAKFPEERESAFRAYKKDLGLPGLASNFVFDIYAWETDYDCALYNLGLPVQQFPPLPFKQAKTSIFTEYSLVRDVNYSVQTSETSVQDLSVSVLHVNKAETEVIRTERSKAENLRVLPIKENYTTMLGFFRQFSPLRAQTAQVGDKCAAFFVDGQQIAAPADLAGKLINSLNKSSALTIFGNELDYLGFFHNFPQSKTVTLAYWNQRNGSCNFPDLTEEEDFTDEEDNDSVNSEPSEFTLNSDADSDDEDYN